MYNKKPAILFLALLLGLLGGIAGSFLVAKFTGTQQAKPNETAFERVMRTGTLRCGYWNWAPLLMAGENGQKLTGIFYDLTEELGKSLSLKIDWAQEVGFGSFAQDLALGKVDAVCGGVWPQAARGRVMEFTDSLFYVPIQLYVRANDTRFDRDSMRLNSADITFGSMDGWASIETAKQYFPKAKISSLPDSASTSEVYEMLASGKVDVIANDAFTSESYIKNNPDKIKEIKLAHPLNFFANTISVNKGEQALVNMLNIGIRDLQNNGKAEAIIEKYETMPNTLLRPNWPYRAQ